MSHLFSRQGDFLKSTKLLTAPDFQTEMFLGFFVLFFFLEKITQTKVKIECETGIEEAWREWRKKIIIMEDGLHFQTFIQRNFISHRTPDNASAAALKWVRKQMET